MLSRRHLRIKVMHTLYAHFQSDNVNVNVSERELLNNIDKVFNLLFYQLSLINEVFDLIEKASLDAQHKHIPIKEEIDTFGKILNNQFFKQISNNEELKNQIRKRKISWSNDLDVPKKVYLDFKNSESFKNYLKTVNSYKEEKDFIINLFFDNIEDSEFVQQYYEEKNINWADDIDFVNVMVERIFKTIKQESDYNLRTLNQFFDINGNISDEFQEHIDFSVNLLRKTINYNEKYSELISEKTKNWEVERIAVIDIVLMKMALCEILEFQTIPVKVSLNEYIEISKMYSTPKSSVFINGVLDKLVEELKSQNLIKKTGRGLFE